MIYGCSNKLSDLKLNVIQMFVKIASQKMNTISGLMFAVTLVAIGIAATNAGNSLIIR